MGRSSLRHPWRLVGAAALLLAAVPVLGGDPPAHAQPPATGGDAGDDAPSQDEKPDLDGSTPGNAGDTGATDGTTADGTTADGTAASPGTTSGTTADAGATPPATAAGPDTPPPLPSFLDTTDRRLQDDRPPPTPEQVAALRDMEAEVARFANVGRNYRETVVSLLRRQYQQQRRGMSQGYARQIKEEESELRRARENAIRVFERFIRRYPDDPEYTPDAMFRLGELYFERSALQFQDAFDEAQAARDRGEDVPIPDEPDYTPTIDLFKRLVRQFPDYERADGVYYLIGYTLNEMGRIEEARLAWLNLVCANKYTYDPDAPTEAELEAADPDAAPDDDDEHPALALGREDDSDDETALEQAPYEDPYVDCQPVREDARFISETWFRIGEYHFDDYFSEHSLDDAIAAYNKIVENPDDRNYNLALYKVAWAYYRNSQFPEAVQHFGLLVDWSDMERERTGRAGSELRPEALQYLGIAFAYDDWNENAVPDVDEGLPSGIQRVQDPNLLPQDRSWTPEVYFSLGEVYFEEAKYPEAIEVWGLAIENFPMHHRVPEITSRIAQAQARRTDLEEDLKRLAAGEWRARLGDYGEGSDWYNANVDHPVEQRDAERLATQALISSAVEYHERASQLRRRCAGEGDPEICREASNQYEAAASAYREFLRQRPNDPEAYEIQFNLAETLYWSGQYEEAAVEYAAIRDSNLDDVRLSTSARMVVESLERVVEIASRDGRVTIREEPPAPQGDPPQVVPVAMPELLQRLAQARELYIARVSEEDDTENVRKAYEFNNALLLYAYGYWPQAEERFARIFDERCTGPLADQVGRRAWLNLNDMAVARNQVDEVERLSRELQERQCTFGETEGIDCSDPANESEPQCLADVQLVNIRYQRAVGIFNQAEQAKEAGSREQANRLFEQAAMLLVQAVNDEPDHPEAPLALEKAATALENVSRFQSAFNLYRRIIDEVGPKRSDDPDKQAELDAIVGYAYFQLAYNANRFFDFDTAVDYYSALADSRRFRESRDDKVRGWRESALINAAIILEQLQQYRRAADYYDRAEDLLTDPEKKRQASFKKAEMAFKQRAWSNAVREMRSFIGAYQGQEGAGPLVVEAYWKIAEARKELRQTRDYKQALRDVVDAFARSGLDAGSYPASLAAQARFELVDERGQDFEDFSISVRSPRTLEDYISSLRARIDAGAQEAESIVNDYNQVLGYRSRAWSVAAYVRQGRVYEQLVQAVLDATRNPVIPTDIARQLRGQPPEAREEVKFTIMDGLEQKFAQSLESAECLALVRYALASRVGRRAALSTEYTREATNRLQAYGEERISQCIEAERVRAQQAGQSPMEGASQGEFRRAPRGQTPDIPQDVAPPAIPADVGGGR